MLGGPDSLIEIAGGHPDVGNHDIGRLLVDRGQERVEVAAHGSDLDLRHRLEQTAHSLADEVVVVGEHEPNRHARRIRP
jgi:hypothetical protein